MKIYIWPYSKEKKNAIIKDIIDTNISAVFHNPTDAVGEFEFIQGEIREFIQSFEIAKEKFENFEDDLHIFYDTKDSKSPKKIQRVLKKAKMEFTVSTKEYPI